MSRRKRFKAVSRWVRPFSILAHSRAVNDAGKKIVGEDALGSLFAAVHGKGNAFVEEREVGGLLAAAQFFGRQLEERLVQCAVMLARNAGRGKHFVISGIDLIVHKGWWQVDA